MATADANGIAIIQDNDNLSPLHPVFNLLGQSVSNAFDANIRIWPVANETARSAKVTEIGLANITGAKPLFVWRANAPAGRNLEFSTNGTVWNYYSSNLDDTGWVPVTIRPGFARQGSNDPAVRRIGKTVYWRWGFSNAGMAANGSYTVADVPVGFRPPNAAAEVYTYAASNSVAAGGRFTVYSNGSVLINTAATLGSYYLAEANWLAE